MFEENSVEDLFRVPVSERYLNCEDRDVFLRRISSTGKIQGYEVELVTSSGKPFWASISATATFGENGELTTVDGVIRDISMVKVLESAGPPFLSLVNYQVPVWAMLFGAVLLGETVEPRFGVALALILIGVAISQNLLAILRRR